jgi:hypothetical protein
MTVDRVVLHGIQPVEAKALTQALESQLSHLLADRTTRRGWAQPHRTPVVKLAPMTLSPGTVGARMFGRGLAGAVARGLNARRGR